MCFLIAGGEGAGSVLELQGQSHCGQGWKGLRSYLTCSCQWQHLASLGSRLALFNFIVFDKTK